jgi:hypothetical protein
VQQSGEVHNNQAKWGLFKPRRWRGTPTTVCELLQHFSAHDDRSEMAVWVPCHSHDSSPTDLKAKRATKAPSNPRQHSCHHATPNKTRTLTHRPPTPDHRHPTTDPPQIHRTQVHPTRPIAPIIQVPSPIPVLPPRIQYLPTTKVRTCGRQRQASSQVAQYRAHKIQSASTNTIAHWR